LTGYRKMAERIVNRVVNKLSDSTGKEFKDCQTETLILSGGVFKNAKEVDQFTIELSAKLAKHELSHFAEFLVSNYGRQTDVILDHMQSISENDPEICMSLAELKFCLENEAVHSLLDFFDRRTGRLYFYIQSIEKIKQPALNYLSQHLGWSKKREKQEIDDLDRAIKLASRFQK
jgi:glycerol-3-phosphate dehydrogenase